MKDPEGVEASQFTQLLNECQNTGEKMNCICEAEEQSKARKREKNYGKIIFDLPFWLWQHYTRQQKTTQHTHYYHPIHFIISLSAFQSNRFFWAFLCFFFRSFHFRANSKNDYERTNLPLAQIYSCHVALYFHSLYAHASLHFFSYFFVLFLLWPNSDHLRSHSTVKCFHFILTRLSSFQRREPLIWQPCPSLLHSSNWLYFKEHFTFYFVSIFILFISRCACTVRAHRLCVITFVAAFCLCSFNTLVC